MCSNSLDHLRSDILVDTFCGNHTMITRLLVTLCACKLIRTNFTFLSNVVHFDRTSDANVNNKYFNSDCRRMKKIKNKIIIIIIKTVRMFSSKFFENIHSISTTVIFLSILTKKYSYFFPCSFLLIISYWNVRVSNIIIFVFSKVNSINIALRTLSGYYKWFTCKTRNEADFFFSSSLAVQCRCMIIVGEN